MTILGGDSPEVQELTRRMAQQEMAKQYVETYMRSTAQIIFAHMVAAFTLQHGADEVRSDLGVIRDLAVCARDFAPFLAEAYGMVNIEAPENGEATS